jgi:RNA polymerase primary sigma factor
VTAGHGRAAPGRDAPWSTRVVETDDLDTDDAVGLYLHDVGAIPLLSAEEEIELARLIEGHGGDGDADWALDHACRDAARAQLASANSRLVVAVARRYANQGVPLPDLIQEGNLGLLKAVDRYDWRRGFKFSTYATWWIRQAVSRAVADQGRTIRVPSHMAERLRRLYHVRRALEQALGRDPTHEEIADEMGLPVRRVAWMLSLGGNLVSLDRPAGEEGDTQLGEFIADEVQAPPARAVFGDLLRDDVEALLATLPPREARVLELRYGLTGGPPHTLKEVGAKFGVTRERVRQIEADALGRLRAQGRAAPLRAYLDPEPRSD